MFHDESTPDAVYSDTLELDLGDVVPSLAGPKRPQDRVALTDAAEDFLAELAELQGGDGDLTGYDEAEAESFPASDPPTSNGGGAEPRPGHEHGEGDRSGAGQAGALAHGALAERHEGLDHGAVVIAAITSCTNTSNPSVMLGAGLLAQKAVKAGLTRKPWVKTSLAPGSKVVTEYLDRAGLTEPLSELGFDLVGYGCTTCIGNSGPLPEEISKEIEERDLVVASVLSGNRNFEGRIHPEVKMNYLASPPLCVAYALAGRMDVDLLTEPLQGDVYLRDLWPSRAEINEVMETAIQSDMFRKSYGEVFEGDENWNALDVPAGDRYAWDPDSTYVRRPPYFEGMAAEPPAGFEPIGGARILAVLGDSVTTDHISPAGAIKKDSPGGSYLLEHGVEQRDFNSYGSRRGNHEVMMRGTFANIRLRNQLAPGTEGGFTKKDGEVTTIYEAAMDYAAEGVPLGVLAGKEYGSGSSRDWAAKGPRLLGVRFVIAESYERIHRSNLVGMGILPLQFPEGETMESLGLTGEETFELDELTDGARTLGVRTDTGVSFEARVRIDTPNEWQYYRGGGILHYVLRGLRG
jgi:aconitate hydratase